MRIIVKSEKYSCTCCRKMTEVEEMFDIEDERICVDCFGGRFFPALERLGYEIIKLNGRAIPRRSEN